MLFSQEVRTDKSCGCSGITRSTRPKDCSCLFETAGNSSQIPPEGRHAQQTATLAA